MNSAHYHFRLSHKRIKISAVIIIGILYIYKQMCIIPTKVQRNNSYNPSHKKVVNEINPWEIQEPAPSKKTSGLSISKVEPYSADMLIYLSGELGNHIGKIAMGYTMKLLAMEGRTPINFRLHWRNQGLNKSRRAQEDVHQCFPNIRGISLSEFNSAIHNEMVHVQQDMFGEDATIFSVNNKFYIDGLDYELKIDNGIPRSIAGIRRRLKYLYRVLQDGKKVAKAQYLLREVDIPFMISDAFCYMELLDRYYEELKELFAFDYEECCEHIPEPDETVMHIRGFSTELKQSLFLGFEELDPHRTATELLGHLKPGDKVALLSRFQTALEPYQEALEERGIEVRTIVSSGSDSGVKDFCFMMHTIKELVGIGISHFVSYAAFLSPSLQKATLYSVENDNKENKWEMKYDWKHPVLKQRFHHPVFQSRYE